MTQDNIEELLQQVNKKSPDNNIWFTSINLTNAYLNKHGTEHCLLKQIYGKYLFIKLFNFCYNINNLSLHVNSKNVLEKFMKEIRIHTYEFRKKCFFEWINNVTAKTNHENPITQCLIKFYNMSESTKVREQLGLNYDIN